MKKRTMSVKDVAHYLGLHPDTVYRFVREEKIPHMKIGSRIFFLQDALEEWLSEQMK